MDDKMTQIPDVKKELASSQTVLLLIPGNEYPEDISKIVKDLADKKVCYITLNKTSESIKELFTKSKVNLKNIMFVDAISKSFKKDMKSDEKSIYVSSPGALTELSIVINKLLKTNEFDYLIFDSITTMTVYETKDAVTRFVSSIVNKIKETKTRAVFYAIGERDNDPFTKKTCMFFDKCFD
jgi:KaiC/GvpD/RAD55 family RecA-like ATPase